MSLEHPQLAARKDVKSPGQALLPGWGKGIHTQCPPKVQTTQMPIIKALATQTEAIIQRNMAQAKKKEKEQHVIYPYGITPDPIKQSKMYRMLPLKLKFFKKGKESITIPLYAEYLYKTPEELTVSGCCGGRRLGRNFIAFCMF